MFPSQLSVIVLSTAAPDAEFLAVIAEPTVYRWYDLYGFVIKHICQEIELSAYDLHIYKWDSMIFDLEWLKQTVEYRCSIKAPRSTAFQIDETHVKRIEGFFTVATRGDTQSRYNEYYRFYMSNDCEAFVNATKVSFDHQSITEAIENSPPEISGEDPNLKEKIEKKVQLIVTALKKV